MKKGVDLRGDTKKLHLHSVLGKETKRVKSKKHVEEIQFFYIYIYIEVSARLTPQASRVFASPSDIFFFFFLVGETLTGLLPATGRAPLVLALHSVNFATLLGLAASLPEGAVSAGGGGDDGLEPVLLQPLFAHTDGAAARLHHRSAAVSRDGSRGPGLRGGAPGGH